MKTVDPTEPTPHAPEEALQPTAYHHLANFLVAGLLLMVVSMVYGLLDWDYHRFLIWKTSTIKGDGPMSEKDAFWYWVNEWLTPHIMVALPTLATLRWVHWSRIFKRPSVTIELLFVAEFMVLSSLFIILYVPYLDHCWGIYI